VTLRGVGRAACRGLPLGLLCVVLAGAAAPATVADELRYSLGTIQFGTTLRIPPEGTADAALGLYNIDGNVTTTVELRVAEAPSWCVVTLEHAAAEVGAEGLTLRIEPSAPQAKMPECAEAGRQAFLVEPRGYVCADVVDIHVEVTGSLAKDDAGVVRLVALARWDSGGGLALPPQEREFLFDIVFDAGDGTAPVQPSGPDTRAWLLLIAALAAAGVLLLRWLLAKSGRLA
jgi:hypothetical protein